MKNALLPGLILLLALAVSARADVTTNLIAWYPFDGNMQDASGFANHGSPVGVPTLTTDRFGTPNEAYEFNGINTYITVPYAPILSSPDTAVTQAAWCLLYGPSLVGQAFGPVIMKSASTPNAFMYRMTVSPGGVGTGFNDWFNLVDILYTFSLNQWYHVATVYNGSSVQFYIDGVKVDSLAFSNPMVPDTRDLVIGGDVPGILEIYYGKLDDVRIYSRALSDGDIVELYNGGPTAVRDTPSLADIAIRRVYPNPTSGDAIVEYSLGSSAFAELGVYDVKGRRVRNLRSGALSAGPQAASWDGRDDAGRPVPSGVYFARLSANGGVVSSRIARLR